MMMEWKQLSLWNRFTSVFFCSFALLMIAHDVFVFVYHPPWGTPTSTFSFMVMLGFCLFFFAISANPKSYQGGFSLKLNDYLGWTKWVAWLGLTSLLLAFPISTIWPYW